MPRIHGKERRFNSERDLFNERTRRSPVEQRKIIASFRRFNVWKFRPVVWKPNPVVEEPHFNGRTLRIDGKTRQAVGRNRPIVGTRRRANGSILPFGVEAFPEIDSSEQEVEFPGPKARPIPAWATGLGPRAITIPEGQGPDPSARLIPDIAFVGFDPVLPEEVPVFVLEGLGPVMFLLVVDVSDHGIEIPRANGEGSVAALPGELGKGGGAILEPLRGGGFQFADEIGDGNGGGKTDSAPSKIQFSRTPEPTPETANWLVRAASGN